MNIPAKLFAFVLFIGFSGCQQAPPQPFLAVNLVGYEPDGLKQAYLVNAHSEQFEIIRADDSSLVYAKTTGIRKAPDLATGDQITLLDFTPVMTPGVYRIRVSNSSELVSEPFAIQESVYADALNTILNSYYFHRCGIKVENDSPWKYEICHLEDAPFYDNPDQSRRVTGGWHDAGDYNKFSGNTALTTGLLLYAYERNPALFSDQQLDIPEAGNGIPDLLDEVSWAMQWLMKMQREDGAVYHKVSQMKWIGEYLPNEDPSTRYIFDISSAATASFTASAALASRHLKGYNPVLSRQLLEAATHSWNFLELHPGNVPEGGFKNPAGVTGGEYGDTSDVDERLWASLELYRLAGDEKYLKYFIRHLEQLNLAAPPPISWRDAHNLALHAFLHADSGGKFEREKERVRQAIVQHADALLDIHKRNNYSNLIQTDEYYWGSNSVGLAYAFELIQAYDITKQQKYSAAALDQLHYIFGRNPFNRSQVTGVGSVSVEHPYHQLSELGNFTAPVPGMLVGGPNHRLLLNNQSISDHPGKNYEDKFNNYLVNEPAINFTAILAYVVAAHSGSRLETDIHTETK